MALQKVPYTINFGKGVDTKTDPFQVPLDKFLDLKNAVFDKNGGLVKRNGFKEISTIPTTDQTVITTFNDSLIAIGANLYSYNSNNNVWYNKGNIQPVSIQTTSLVKNSGSQSNQDAVVAPNGLVCTTYISNGNVYYEVADSVTGTQIVSQTQLTNGVANPKVFLLDAYFIVTCVCAISPAYHIQFIAIPLANPTSPTAQTDFATDFGGLSSGYDGAVANGNVYFVYSTSGSSLKIGEISSGLIVSATTPISGYTASLVSVSVDNTLTSPILWSVFYNGTDINTIAFDQFGTLLPGYPLSTVTSVSLKNITCAAQNSVCTILYEVNNHYASPYPSTVQTDYIRTVTVTQTGTVRTPTTVLRSVGLASKAFISSSGVIYTLVAYGATNQPTYFIIDASGNIYAKLAYSNGGGYITGKTLPTVTFDGTYFYVSYLYKDFLTTVNKNTNNTSGTPINAIYSQTGINLCTFSINDSPQYSSEIANSLHLTGGQLWQYDGVKPVEQNFHVWPEDIAYTTATTGGNITAQQYYYVFTYEWTDNVGNIHRSAPSIPLLVNLSSAGTSTSVNTLYVPTLRLTYKTSPNPVRLVGYRWSAAQQVYYQFTSVTNPNLNDPTVDFISITDTLADSAILGNAILYTTGGVVENISPPACSASALYANRLFLVDAEDRNLLWYSKQIIESTPVEMSDLFTIYVAPTSGAQGSTGDITALSAMDDKLIIFKRDAIYYMTGIGPDNTGANNDFSTPTYITSNVGCSNPRSIVLMPQGLMFQSDKGIWLLGRDLSTQYIGAPVEAYNNQTVESALSIPGTNEVRFVLNNNLTLMYDYYYQQWGTFTNLSAISATLYQSTHTYLSAYGTILQETPGYYTDGSSPVLMSFKSAWITLAGLQGYERFYQMLLLGKYYTPFKLNVQIGYDFNEYNTQSIIVSPDNYTPNWGGSSSWGATPQWGGPGNVFESRVFPRQQKCNSFQIQITEVYDNSYGVLPGQGLYLSGMTLITGMKKGYRTQKASRSFG